MHSSYEEEVVLTITKSALMEEETQDRSSSLVWVNERRKRVTASNAGKIVKRRGKTCVKSLVKQRQYNNFRNNKYTAYEAGYQERI